MTSFAEDRPSWGGLLLFTFDVFRFMETKTHPGPSNPEHWPRRKRVSVEKMSDIPQLTCISFAEIGGAGVGCSLETGLLSLRLGLRTGRVSTTSS